MTIRIGFDATATHKLVSVTAAEAVALYPDNNDKLPWPITIRAKPGGGGTLLVEYQVEPNDDWTAWPDGTVAVATVAVMAGPMYALRFTAAAATGTIALNHD